MKNFILMFSVLLAVSTYSQDIKKLTKLAEKGDVQAQAELADAYFNGKGVNRSYQDAVVWLEKVAESGDAKAQYQLGQCYFIGQGVAKSEEKAAEWFEKAANGGNVDAQRQLALCYRDGKGVAQSTEKYYQWTEKNADNESPEVQLALAKAYQTGDGVAKDLQKARSWAQKAAAKGNLEAEYLVASWAYEANPNSGDALQQLMKVAEKGNPDAQYTIGMAYLEGKGVQKSEEKAIEWFEKAAAKGNPDAAYKLGNYYFYGNSPLIPKFYKKAIEYYTRAAIKGNADAQRQLAVCLYNGIGEAQSFRDAFNWISKSVNSSPTPVSENNLGVCYATGNGTRPSPQQAIDLFQKAADEGDVMAQYNLGAIFLEEATLDVRKGFEYLEKAASKNNLLALKKLGDLHYNGRYTNISHTRAFEYYLKAAQKEPLQQNESLEYFYQQENEAYAEVLYLLSQCYANGKGVKKSEKDAAEWAVKAANLGNQTAFDYLLKRVEANDPKDPPTPEMILAVADGYYYGKLVRKSTEKAFALYEKLAKQENTTAQKRLIEFYLDAKNPQKDQEKAIAWQEKVAKKGDAETQYNLGKYYMTMVPDTNTNTTEKGKAQASQAKTNTATTAVASTTTATHRGMPSHRSAVKTGLKPIAKPKTPMKRLNETKGLLWLNKASEQNYVEAQDELGNFYNDKQEYAQAFNFYQKAANNNSAIGCFKLANCYYNGTGTERSFERAAELYKKSARQGYALAQYRLGHCYFHGEGLKQSDSRAADWFEQACDNGEQRGCEMLKVVTKK